MYYVHTSLTVAIFKLTDELKFVHRRTIFKKKNKTRVSVRNAGQVGLGSSRPESSRPGSTRPGYLGLVLYSLLFSIKGMPVRLPVPFFLCVVLKMFNKSLKE